VPQGSRLTFGCLRLLRVHRIGAVRASCWRSRRLSGHAVITEVYAPNAFMLGLVLI
jgi:hypothetical protein